MGTVQYRLKYSGTGRLRDVVTHGENCVYTLKAIHTSDEPRGSSSGTLGTFLWEPPTRGSQRTPPGVSRLLQRTQ